MIVQTSKPFDKRIKNHYLMFVEGGCMHPIAQLKVPPKEFWDCMAKWLKEDFGVTVEFQLTKDPMEDLE